MKITTGDYILVFMLVATFFIALACNIDHKKEKTWNMKYYKFKATGLCYSVAYTGEVAKMSCVPCDSLKNVTVIKVK